MLDKTNILVRQAHAVLDLPSRFWKARKIDLLLDIPGRFQGREAIRLLDIGTGIGGIAHYFSRYCEPKCEVHAVDVNDNRQITEGYSFQQVVNTHLPFADASFDVVLSNHVIEHVGDAAAQEHHLAEIRRVLSGEGVGYLAVPNRWMLIEPHFQLIFLSWLPVTWRTPWLRLWRKGKVYDCAPFSLGELKKVLRKSGLSFRNVSLEATRLLFEIERPRAWTTRLLRFFPDAVLRPCLPIIPTLCHELVKVNNERELLQ